MRKLLFLVMTLFMTVPTLGHGGTLARETLKKFFPEAENFVSRKKSLTPQQLLQVEKASGDEVQAVDRDLTVYVAVGKDPQTGKMQSIGAVLMVDAAGAKGAVDMAVGFNLDGSIRKVLVLENLDDKELESETFLGQLEGKGPSDSWDLENGFRLVGNPASAKAVIRAVRRGMYLFLAFMGR
jgi:hypothetical protein